MSEDGSIYNAREKALKIIRLNGGIIKTSLAIREGIHPATLYKLHSEGELEQLSRGIYHLGEIHQLSNPDFVIVASRCPNSVVCLTSALSFHEMTTFIPHEISLAIVKNSKPSTLQYPPVKFYKFSQESFTPGIENHKMDGVNVKVYSPEKTLADCFKFRNKIGMDIVLEALKLYKLRKKQDFAAIMDYAKACRVANIMHPYLELII